MGQALLPFVPPFLRVNADTWNELPSGAEIRNGILNVWTSVSFWRIGVLVIWIAGLYGVHACFDAAAVLLCVILSGFIGVWMNLGDNKNHPEEMSAYSVFNQGGERMLGSLNAEQFENEIRHRAPQLDNTDYLNDDDDDDDDDLIAQEQRDIQLAMKLSLEKSPQKIKRKRKGKKKQR